MVIKTSVKLEQVHLTNVTHLNLMPFMFCVNEKMFAVNPCQTNVEIDMKRKDGTIRHLDVSMKSICWDGRQQYQTLYSDITEQKQAQETIEKRSRGMENHL